MRQNTVASASLRGNAAMPASTGGTTRKLTQGIASRLAGNASALASPNHAALIGSSVSVTAACAQTGRQPAPPAEASAPSGPPSILFYDSSGNKRPELSLVGFVPADEFVQHVQGLN